MEREREHQHQLLPETRRLLEEVEQLTGRPVMVRADANVASRGRAIYAVSDPNPERHLVLYDPSQARFLDHLVGHELGHVLHFDEAAPADRRVPVVTGECRSRALRQLLPELEILLRRGFPAAALAEVFPIWLSGTVAQLSDTPSDVRIERWLFEKHPNLGDAQRSSLREQSRTLQMVLRPQVERITPPSLWLASNAMNYVLLKSVAEFLQEPGFIRPYLGNPSHRLGEELIRLSAQHRDENLTADRLVSDAWAEHMGLAGWYEWRRLDELSSSSGPIGVE